MTLDTDPTFDSIPEAYNFVFKYKAEGQALQPKNPMRVAAAHKAWATMRARKPKQASKSESTTAELQLGSEAHAIEKLRLIVGLSEEKQISLVMESWSNIGKIHMPSLTVQLLAVALNARAFKLIHGKADELVQMIMLRKNRKHIEKLPRGHVSEKAVLTVIKGDISIIALLDESAKTNNLIAATTAQFRREIRYLSEALKYTWPIQPFKLERVLQALPHILSYMSENDKKAFEAIAPTLMARAPDIFMKNFSVIPQDLCDESYANISEFFGVNDVSANTLATAIYMATADEDQKIHLMLKHDAHLRAINLT